MKKKPTPARGKGFLAERERKRIRPDDEVTPELNDKERELILRHTFADDDLTHRLRIVSRAAGYVAAEANHARDKTLKKQFASLFDRVQTIMESYTDQYD